MSRPVQSSARSPLQNIVASTRLLAKEDHRPESDVQDSLGNVTRQPTPRRDLLNQVDHAQLLGLLAQRGDGLLNALMLLGR